MLRFFSKLRYKLATENRAAKYLRYAVGEILLVVIGILIAIGLNNLRDQYKENKLELTILQQIEETMKQDSLFLQELTTQMEEKFYETQDLKNYMKEDKPYVDSLKGIFSSISYFNGLTPNQTSFDKLKDAGINIIKNDSLQNMIPIYFRSMELLLNINETYDLSVYFRNKIYPKYFKSFMWNPEIGSEPKDFEQLKKSDDFYVALDYVINDSGFYFLQYQMAAKSNAKLLRLLRTELSQRNK